MLDVALSEEAIKAIWLSFGYPSSLVPHVRKRRPDILIFHQLHSAREAVDSLRKGNADVIVAQGTE
jgi:NAD(P)H-dependent flavin oxidoreductase YrpB (nitropropane dioxygenase family)